MVGDEAESLSHVYVNLTRILVRGLEERGFCETRKLGNRALCHLVKED